MHTKLACIKNIKNLSIGTDRTMQTVQTQIRRRREKENETNLGGTGIMTIWKTLLGQ